MRVDLDVKTSKSNIESYRKLSLKGNDYSIFVFVIKTAC